MKAQISPLWKFRWGVYVFILFLLSTALLVGTPQAVKLAESSITSVNQNQELPNYITSEVYGASKMREVEIVQSDTPPPLFSSNAVLAQDVESKKILYQKNIHSKLSPASTTKIMTALVASEYFKPADVLTVTSDAMVGGSTMGLSVGEKLTFRSLLYGMMLNSGNDAAYAIATNYPGGLTKFIEKMNQKVRELGLTDTNFSNPAGFDAPNHYSSAYDLAIIANESIKNSQLSRVVSTKETSVLSWDKTKSHNLKNLNQLLSEQGVLGIKTGFTEKAGENLVGLVERDNRRVLTVVLSSQNRFGETKSLIDWVYKSFEWKTN